MNREPCRVGPFRDAATALADRTAVGAVDRIEPWRDMLREHFVALDVAADDDAFRSTVRSTLLGHLSVAEVVSGPQSCVRTSGLAGAGEEPYLQVGLIAGGRAVLEQDGRQAELGPGAFAVYETDRPFAWHFAGPWKLLVLTWPRHLVELGADVSRAATARPFGATRLDEIVGHALTETVLAPPALSDEGGRRLATELSALLGTTVGECLRRDEVLTPSSAEDLRRRVDAYIDERVQDPDLGPEEIARAHFVSVRGLYRAFADAETTVSALIRRRRLEHARHRLLDPRGAHLSLTEIAHSSGFVDLPTFSRAFKLEYQESPSSYRRRGGLHVP